MALFGRSEEKEEAKLQKEEAKLQEFLRSKNLEGIDGDIGNMVSDVSKDMIGIGLMKTGLALSFAKSEEQVKIGYASAQVEQNWIIIKQQDAILKELRKLNDKTI